MAVNLFFNTNSLKWAGLFTGLLLLCFACSKRSTSFTTSIPSKDTLQKIVDEGILLETIDTNNHSFLFHFENQKIELPKEDIKNINPLLDQWKTIVTFADQSQISIPSKGKSLDFIIKNIKLNPSGYNPLAAKVEVALPTYGRIKVTIHGKNGKEGTVTHLCHSEIPHQTVPILGLYANYKNKVDLTFTDKEGNERGTTQITIPTSPLTFNGLPQFNIVRKEIDKMEPGVNFVDYPGPSKLDVSIPYMVDNEGEIRWIVLLKTSPELGHISISSGLLRTQKGTFLTGDQNQQRIVEFDLFGNLVQQWDLKKMGYSFHHDISIGEKGNFLITVTKNAARLTNGKPRVMDHIIALNPQTGSLVREWDLAKIVDSSRYLKPDGITPPQFTQNPTNWAHNNGIISFNNNLLASMRYQGIIGFSHSGNLQWIISPHKFWSQKYQSYLLQPIDEAGHKITDSAVIKGEDSTPLFDWPWGPHTPVALSNDRILLFDNGFNRHWVNNALTPEGNYSRIVEYKIDKEKRTVQQLWAYGRARGASCFSVALSGVQYLSQTGHVLFCPGMGLPTQNGRGGRIVEIDPQTKEILFEMEITVPSNTAFHRVTRMKVYPQNL